MRLQRAGGGSPFAVAADIVRKEGFGTLYTGLSAGVLRQITYTSSRLGIFKRAPRPRRPQPRARALSVPPRAPPPLRARGASPLAPRQWPITGVPDTAREAPRPPAPPP